MGSVCSNERLYRSRPHLTSSWQSHATPLDIIPEGEQNACLIKTPLPGNAGRGVVKTKEKGLFHCKGQSA